MVHNELQYNFIYQFVHYWFNKLDIDDTDQPIRPWEVEDRTKQKDNSHHSEPEEPETNEGVSDKLDSQASGEGEEELIEQVPIQHDSGENPDLQLDMIHKPPPIKRNQNKPQFMF